MNATESGTGRRLIFLGTALWGLGVERSEAHRMLDAFVATGRRYIDTATNYPINGRAQDFGLASHWIADWLRTNGTSQLSVLIKIGATDNFGGPKENLSPSLIDVSEEIFRGRFGDALWGLAVHWDNRDNRAAIADSVESLAELHSLGLAIGFSGVADIIIKLPIISSAEIFMDFVQSKLLESRLAHWIETLLLQRGQSQPLGRDVLDANPNRIHLLRLSRNFGKEPTLPYSPQGNHYYV